MDLWESLKGLAGQTPPLHDLFAAEANRAARYTIALDKDFAIDFSKQPLTEEILSTLLQLAGQQQVEKWRAAMFAGEAINSTENRAVLHTRLRAGTDAEVEDTLKRMYQLSESVRNTGKIKTIVHIGIGGSHLGPEMVVKALRPFHDGPAVRFVANVDPADMSAALTGLNPAETLFIVASKTFTTQETMANAEAARRWLVAVLGEAAVRDHFVAASTNIEAVEKFGINPENMFPFKDWVGGRYSLWSSIGLPIIFAVGPARFAELLAGARSMDEHFAVAPLEKNLPVLMALVGVLNRNGFNRGALAVLPYAQDLSLLVSFLQQLEMESNGKSVRRDGTPVAQLTCPVVFGQPGSNGQHAFHQQLHQGPEIVPCDFIVPLSAHADDEKIAPGQHRLLAMNAFAQAAALLSGKSDAGGHRNFSGNRPSTTLLLNALTPYSLGRLLALYEHKVAVQGWLWEINSFDQFGVELGKELAKNLLAGNTQNLDGSTQALFARLPA